MDEIVVMASDPTQMREAHDTLGKWFGQKADFVQTEVDELQTNLGIAKENEWHTPRIKSALLRAKRRQIFYDKCGKAVEAGYSIIPNLPTDTFAVRVKENKKVSVKSMSYNWNPPTQGPDQLPAGDGMNVGDALIQSSQEYEVTDSAGNTSSKTEYTWEDLTCVNFPVPSAKPAILNAVVKALDLKIFDEIGILPARRQADPIIVGKVKCKTGGYSEKELSFLIAWWIDTKDL